MNKGNKIKNTEAAGMIKVKEIKIKRAEGPHTSDFTEHAFKFFSDCSAHIRRMAATAPDTGGYDKCDFNIEWSDGETYKGRFDMKRDDDANDNHLQHQINGFINYLAENGDDKDSQNAIEFKAGGYEGINN